MSKKAKAKKTEGIKKRNISVALKLMGWEESLPKLNQKLKVNSTVPIYVTVGSDFVRG